MTGDDADAGTSDPQGAGSTEGPRSTDSASGAGGTGTDAAAQSRPRGRRPLTNPRQELLGGPRHGGQAVVPGVGLPTPVSDIPQAPPGPGPEAGADGGRQGEHRADLGES
ncbi:hypothetical protein ACTWP5_17560 [Streptomyces sp. 4N509B]|uniref:hypothetical protein n=1 Tax=Streptomyces sp. 4N509B TaxID=3457413 RepID=UPI003FD462F0